MKKLLTILFLFGLSLNSYSQLDITKRKVTLDSLEARNDSIYVLSPMTGGVAKFDTYINAAMTAGNATEVQYNNGGGVLGASPDFTYDSTNKTLNIDSLKLGIGEKISWNPDRYTLNIPSGLGWTNQAGQELNILVYNNSGSLIPNGTAVYPNGTFNDVATLGLGKSNSHETIGVDYGLTTTSLDDGNYGGVVWFGEANDLNTSMYDLGDTLWISSTDEGELTNVRPTFPNYAIQIGIVFKVGVSDGVVFVTSRSSIGDTFDNFWNGIFRETFDFLVTESGGVITGTLTPSNGHPNMTMIFSDGEFFTLDTDPGATITLTAGTDANPQTNYIYVPSSTKVLTLSTSDWPTTEHIKVAQVLLQTANTTSNNGVLRNQNWNDAIQNTSTNQGHLSHITEKLRQFEAQWDNGAEVSITIGVGDEVWASNTAGEIYQLHKTLFEALDMETGDSISIVNDFTTPYDWVADLSDITTDISGNLLSNTSYSVVVWGVCNKTGQTDHLMANFPTATYSKNSPDNAVSDALNYSVYSIPKDFQGVGFLMARFTFVNTSGVWALYDTEDLRGKVPNTTAGGGGGGGGVTSFLGLDDTESSYTAYEFQVANAGANALESPLGMRYHGDSLVVDNNSIVHGNIGIGTDNPLSALHLDKGIGSISTGMSFGTLGNTGFYEAIDGNLVAVAGGVSGFFFNSQYFRGITNGRFSIDHTQGLSAIVPIYSFRGDVNTGINSPVADQLSIIAGGKEIARASENVTEQFGINPQGDYTGTLANPSLYISDVGTGFYKPDADNFVFGINGIESMRLTEDTVFVDSTFAPLQIKFPDGTIQTTAGTGDFTGVMQVVKAEVLYTNTTQTTIITLPTDAVIWEIGLGVSTIFNDSGFEVLKVGVTGTEDKYISGEDLSVVGTVSIGTQTMGTYQNMPDTISGSTNVTFTYVGENTDATQGQAFVYIHYTTH